MGHTGYGFGRRSAVAIVVIASLAAGDRQASADEKERAELEEIVVTAQKREQDILDVPAIVSVLDGEALEYDSAITDVADLATLVPTLTFTDGTNPGNITFRIRGIGTEVFSDSVEPAVSIVVDNVVLSRQAQASFDLLDIERVEVLKGPQGTLFGKNASAGLLHIITRDPTDKLEVRGDVLYSPEDQERRVRLGVSGPIVEGLSGRLNGFYRGVDDWATNFFNGGQVNGVESWGVRGKLQYEPIDTMRLLLIADYRDQRSECCNFMYRSTFNPLVLDAIDPVVPGKRNRDVNEDNPLRSDADTWGVSLQAEWEIYDHTLVSITGFRSWAQEDIGSFDGLPFEPPADTPLILLLQGSDRDHRTFTQELRLVSPEFDTFDYVAGLFYFDAEVDRVFDRIANVGPNLAAESRFGNTVTTRNFAVFGQATWHLLEQLHLTGGIRYTHEEVKFDYFRVNPDNLLGGNFVASDRASDDDVSGTAAISYDVTEDVVTYFRYARGYKGLGFDLTSMLDEEVVARGPVSPETSNAFEIGVKARLLDGRVSGSLAGFWTLYEDYQAQSLDPGTQQFALLNAGEVETRGVELETLTFLTSDWTLTANFAFVDAVFAGDFLFQCFPGQTAAEGCALSDDPDVASQQNLKGGTLPNSPEFKVTLGTSYRHELPWWSLDGVVNASGNWQDNVNFALDGNPSTVQSSYGTANLSIGVADQDNRFRFSVFANNLFDQSFASFIFPDLINPSPVPEGSLVSPGRGEALQILTRRAKRVIGIQASWNF